MVQPARNRSGVIRDVLKRRPRPMLIHLAPSCFAPYGQDVALLSVEIPQIGMVLREGKYLRTRRPYPNRGYLVASAASERAAKDGLFIETETHLERFNVVSRWAIEAQDVMEHIDCFTILDDAFDAVSVDPMLWGSIGSWKNRWPNAIPHDAPVTLKPCLKLTYSGEPRAGSGPYSLPSLERARVTKCAGMLLPGNRTPAEAHAFRQDNQESYSLKGAHHV